MTKCPHCEAEIDSVLVQQSCTETGILDEDSDEFIVTNCTNREWETVPEVATCFECGGEIKLSDKSTFDY